MVYISHSKYNVGLTVRQAQLYVIQPNIMATSSYPPPVSKLLQLGRPDETRPDYRALGLNESHIPELMRLATDEYLNWESEIEIETYAPVHAWLALGQLRAVEAIDTLLSCLRYIDEHNDDWAGERLPEVFGEIGPAAVAPLTRYLQDSTHGLWARVAASGGLAAIAERHPAARRECVAALTAQLQRHGENDPTLNAFLISRLLDVRALEAAPVIESAFADKAVDISVAGDWEDVQISLGLQSQRDKPRPNYLERFFEDREPRAASDSIRQWNAALEAKRAAKEAAKAEKKSKKHKRSRR